MKNIIICNQTKNEKINNLNIFKNAFLYNDKKLYNLYDGRFINPPFFDNIYIIL